MLLDQVSHVVLRNLFVDSEFLPLHKWLVFVVRVDVVDTFGKLFVRISSAVVAN